MKQTLDEHDKNNCPVCVAEAYFQRSAIQEKERKKICPKTLSGNHVWPTWIGKGDYPMCIACGIIDDLSKKKNDKHL